MPPKVEISPSKPLAFFGQSRSVFELVGYGLIIYGIFNLLIVLSSQGNTSEELIAKVSATTSLFPVLFIGSFLTLVGPISDGILVKWVGFQQLVKYFVLLMAVVYLLSVPFSLFTIYNIENVNSNALKRLSTRLEQRNDEIMQAISSISDIAAFAPTLSQFPELSANIYLPPNITPSAVREAISKTIQRGIDQQIKQLKQNQIFSSIRLRRTCRNNAISSFICGSSFLALASRIFPWLMSAQLKLQKIKSTIFSIKSTQNSMRPSAFSKMIQRWKDYRRRRNIYHKRMKDERQRTRRRNK